ncbi:MAG TPA: DUF5808 domain-containing protein [Solirubrobacteraceae bacterium]|jgi:hypothetical protein|nr:DUF5808 domain-containing protein [Solirubrobacteraceae bacterium]
MNKQDRSGRSESQTRAGGLPYNWHRPTVARLRSRAWNPDDHRLFTPKVFGWGYGLNFYWLAHPGGYLAARHDA